MAELLKPRLGEEGIEQVVFTDFGPHWINKINSVLGEPKEVISPEGGGNQELANYYVTQGSDETGDLSGAIISLSRIHRYHDPYFKLNIIEMGDVEDDYFYPEIAAFAVDSQNGWVDFFAFEKEVEKPVWVARVHSSGQVQHMHESEY